MILSFNNFFYAIDLIYMQRSSNTSIYGRSGPNRLREPMIRRLKPLSSVINPLRPARMITYPEKQLLFIQTSSPGADGGSRRAQWKFSGGAGFLLRDD